MNSLIYGVGIADLPRRNVDGSNSRLYDNWRAMLRRCYSDNYHLSKPKYSSCIVSDDWLTLSSFEKSASDMIGYDQWLRNGWHLDKDIIKKGNNTYCKDNCRFVPSEVNSIIPHKRLSSNTGLPVGVYFNGKNKSKYRASLNYCGKYITVYVGDDVEDVFNNYADHKKLEINRVAEKWKGLISDDVYESLINWVIDIND